MGRGAGCSHRFVGGRYIFFEKRLSTLFLDSLKSRKFQITVKDVATVDGLCGYVYLPHWKARECLRCMVIHICVRPLHPVACSDGDGQCESLNEWERATDIGSHAFLFINQSLIICQRVSPAANLRTQMDSSALAPYFKFYDELVSDWLSNTRYLSEKYLPEPWWGWSDCGEELKAVIINLNPGDGGILQTRRYIRFGIDSSFSYREAMADGSLGRHLEGAARWHKAKRENPILEAIAEKPTSPSFSENTLCIEAYPFHSPNFCDFRATEFYGQDPMKHFIYLWAFAAEASKMVSGKLKNLVLVRMSFDRLQRLIKGINGLKAISLNFGDEKDTTQSRENDSSSVKLKAFKIDISEIIDSSQGDNISMKSSFERVRFLCIWGKGCRNNLPNNLKDLLATNFNQETN